MGEAETSADDALTFRKYYHVEEQQAEYYVSALRNLQLEQTTESSRLSATCHASIAKLKSELETERRDVQRELQQAKVERDIAVEQRKQTENEAREARVAAEE